jgi:hypothetical protein
MAILDAATFQSPPGSYLVGFVLPVKNTAEILSVSAPNYSSAKPCGSSANL